MSALSAHVRLLRRARRLLPAALRTVAVLVPPGGASWEGSPLSRLPLGGGGRGVVGLRLERGVAVAIREQGMAWLRQAMFPRGGWRRLPVCDREVFWSECGEARLALLLDPVGECLWLFWQEEAREAGRRCCS